MDQFTWLALQQSAVDGPVLVENTNVYAQLPQLPPRFSQIVLFIRGCTQRENQVSVYTGRTGVIVDCSLHIQHRISKLKAGHPDSNINLHPLGTSQQLPRVDIAQRLYSLILAPLSTVILLVEDEFSSLDEIIHLLASWVFQSTGQ